jgi:F-type H+-transporting ATPase subunit epsilon
VPLQVELVSVDRMIWSGSASMVVARTVDGEVGVLPGHAPVLALLSSGDIRITPTEGGVVYARADDGFLSIEHDRVTIVSERAALADAGAV